MLTDAQRVAKRAKHLMFGAARRMPGQSAARRFLSLSSLESPIEIGS